MTSPSQRYHWLILLVFTLIAFWIWFRQTTWLALEPDAVAILAVFPLAWWLIAPLERRIKPLPGDLRAFCWAAAIFACGALLDLTFLMALGWTLGLIRYLHTYWQSHRFFLPRLGFLLILAFPWIPLDAPWIGWWFRISGAWVSQIVFDALGFAVHREGVSLLIDGLPVSIEAACSGINLLQALAIGGMVLALINIQQLTRLCVFIACLPLLGWLANTLRMLLITAVGLHFEVSVASGLFHTWGATVVILLMLGFCHLLALLLSTPQSEGVHG